MVLGGVELNPYDHFECSVSSLKALILDQASSVTCSRFLGGIFAISGDEKLVQFVKGDLKGLKGNKKSLSYQLWRWGDLDLKIGIVSKQYLVLGVILQL